MTDQGIQRLPCIICSAPILPDTAARNGGMCGRCIKGHRPCPVCGKHVSQPLKDSGYIHMECWLKKREADESMKWDSIEDIDQSKVTSILSTALKRLFSDQAGNGAVAAKLDLLVYIKVQDFVDITVINRTDPNAQTILNDSNPKWDKDISPISSSYSILIRKLEDEAQDQLDDHFKKMLLGVVTHLCHELEADNFFYPATVAITWSVKLA